MKTATFEFGKQSLAEWIENNRDCEKMILVGEVGYDQLFGLNSIGKDFCPVEFDITDMHLIDHQGEIDIEVFPFDKQGDGIYEKSDFG